MRELREAFYFTRQESSAMHRTFALARSLLLLLAAFDLVWSCVSILTEI